MADFTQNLKKIIEESGNVCITENGAVAYKTTGRSLLDLNFKISSMRSMSEADKIKLMTSVYNEDRKLFIKSQAVMSGVRLRDWVSSLPRRQSLLPDIRRSQKLPVADLFPSGLTEILITSREPLRTFPPESRLMSPLMKCLSSSFIPSNKNGQ